MNIRTQNIISLSINSGVIIGSLAISSYAYSIAPQLSVFNPVPRIGIAIALGIGVKFFRSYPYYLSTLPTPAPGAWKWLLIGLALEGFDLAVLGYMFKVKLSIDSALGAIACLWGWSGSWSMVSLMADLGLQPVRRQRFYSQWFAKSAKPRASAGDVSVIDRGELLTDYQKVELGTKGCTTIDPDIIRNLLGDSMKSGETQNSENIAR